MLIKLWSPDGATAWDIECIAADVFIFTEQLHDEIVPEDFTLRAHTQEAVRYANQLLSLLRNTQSVTVGDNLAVVIASQISLLRGMLRHVS